MASTAKPRSYSNFGAEFLGAMVVGLILGFIARQIGPDAAGHANWLAHTLQQVGSIFVTLLRALVPPLIFAAIITSIANLGHLQNAAKLAWQTLLWFAITALIAVAIGIALGLMLQPGTHAAVSETLAKAPGSTGSSFDFLKGLVPSNILGIQVSTTLKDAAATTSLNFNALQIVVISIVVGVAALRVGERAEPFLGFIRSLLVIIHKILWWVIRLTPIGTIGLLGNAVAQYGWDALAQVGWFAAAVYLGLAFVLLLVYPTLLSLNGLDPWKFFKKVWPATQLGFVSRSSIGTLPLTERIAEQRLGVPGDYAAFAVPLGATTKMDGCAAIYPAIAALFVAQFYGLPLGIGDYLLIAFVSVIGSAATAGLTSAIVMLTLTLSTLGLPLEGVGLLLAIDPILDMGRTAVNVTGQALVPTIVAKRQGMLDQARYNSDETIAVLDARAAAAAAE